MGFSRLQRYGQPDRRRRRQNPRRPAPTTSWPCTLRASCDHSPPRVTRSFSLSALARVPCGPALRSLSSRRTCSAATVCSRMPSYNPHTLAELEPRRPARYRLGMDAVRWALLLWRALHRGMDGSLPSGRACAVLRPRRSAVLPGGAVLHVAPLADADRRGVGNAARRTSRSPVETNIASGSEPRSPISRG